MNKIPKIIHYCWFGNNPLPDDYKKNIESWKKYMPDYKIVCWNESNYDINKCQFIKEAYENKKWAFVTDYARLDIIYNKGGIYLDTDVEVLKSFDDLLVNDAFMGFETSGFVNTGIGFGAKKGNNTSFIKNNGELDLTGCPIITTNILKKHNLNVNMTTQNIDGLIIFSPEYFCPLNYDNGNLNITSNTYSIHKYSMSWFNEKEKRYHLIEQKLSRILGIKMSKRIIFILRIPERAINKIIIKYKQR